MSGLTLREVALALGFALMFIGPGTAGEAAPLIPAPEPDAPPEVDLGAQAPRAAAPAEPAIANKEEVPPASLVKSFLDREHAHESIFKMAELRRAQARENPGTFWQNYEIPGPTEILDMPVTFKAEDALLAEVFGSLTKITGAQFEFMPGLERRRVSVDLTDDSLRQVLVAISQASDIVPIHDKYANSIILVDLRDPEPVVDLENQRVPLRLHDPVPFLEFCRQLGLEEEEGTFVPDGEERAFLYTGSRKNLNPMRSFIRDFDRRPPPEGVEYHMEVMTLEHQDPARLVTELRRAYHGNFAARGNKIGVIVIPSQLDQLKARVVEYDQPAAPTEPAATIE